MHLKSIFATEKLEKGRPVLLIQHSRFGQRQIARGTALGHKLPTHHGHDKVSPIMLDENIHA